jgi:uncharacterized protein YjeT (DUF2065 family)
MSHAGWEDVWWQALTLLGAQPAFIRILAGLSAALCAVIFVEGLRACFMPRKAARAVIFFHSVHGQGRRHAGLCQAQTARAVSSAYGGSQAG